MGRGHGPFFTHTICRYYYLGSRFFTARVFAAIFLRSHGPRSRTVFYARPAYCHFCFENSFFLRRGFFVENSFAVTDRFLGHRSTVIFVSRIVFYCGADFSSKILLRPNENFFTTLRRIFCTVGFLRREIFAQHKFSPPETSPVTKIYSITGFIF